MELTITSGTPAILPVTQVTAATATPVSNIREVRSLYEIPRTLPRRTLVLSDIDDTLFDHKYMIGSKAWRAYFSKAAPQIDASVNWHDYFSYFLALVYPIQTVEPTTSHFIRSLQDEDHVVCGLTARERNKWYDMSQRGIDVLTTQQLNKVNIDFNNLRLENTYGKLAENSEYYQGTFFANTDYKGEYLLNLLEDAPDISYILFIDDKLAQVHSVEEALTQLGIPHGCYLYRATDEKAHTFNPLIANIQLHALYLSGGKTILTNEQAAKVAEDNSGKTAEHYLRETIEHAKINLEKSEAKRKQENHKKLF